MRKILIGVLVAAAVIVGGLKFYLWYSVKHAADSLAAVLQPVAPLSYDGIISSLSGRIGLTGISIYVPSYDTTIRIDSLAFEADSVASLLSLKSALSENRLPKHMAFKVKGASLPVNSELAAEMPGMHPGLWGVLGLPYGSLACGNYDGFDSAALAAMGVRNITLDAELGYTIDRQDDVLKLNIRSNAPTLGRQSIELDYAAEGIDEHPERLRGIQNFPLAGGAFHYTDQGWHKKLRAFCARKTNVDEAGFVKAQADAIQTAIAHYGIHAGDTFHQAYVKFMQDGGSVALDLYPPKPVKLEQLKFYSVPDKLYYLGPSLKVNGTSVPVDQLRAATDAEKQAAETALAKMRPKTPSGDDNFQPISVSELDRHVGDTVRLHVTTGRTYVGKLTSIRDRIAHLEVGSDHRAKVVPVWEIDQAAVPKPAPAAE